MRLYYAFFIILVFFFSFVTSTSYVPICSQEVIDDLKIKHNTYLPYPNGDIKTCSISSSLVDNERVDGFSYQIKGEVISENGNIYDYEFYFSTDSNSSYINYTFFRSEDDMIKLVNFIERLDVYNEYVPTFLNSRRDIGNLGSVIVGYGTPSSYPNQQLWFYFRDNKLYAYPGYSAEISNTSALGVFDISELNLEYGRIEVNPSSYGETISYPSSVNRIWNLYLIIFVILVLVITLILWIIFKKKKTN